MGEQDDKPPLRSDNCAAFAFFMSCMFWNCLTLNFTHMRMPDPQLYPPLRDAGFDLIPIIRLQWITDAMIGYYNVVIILLWLFVSIIDKDVAKCRHMFNKYFMVWGYCMLMRGFSIALTSLPATENHCQDPKVIDDVWVNTVVGFLTFGGKNVHCGDLMFSGHTIAIMNGTCFVAHYARMFPVLVVATMMCSCMCVFLIIASRSHYTIDVYVAGCISFLTFKSTPEALPTFLAPVSNMFAKLGVNSLLLLPRRKCDSPFSNLL